MMFKIIAFTNKTSGRKPKHDVKFEVITTIVRRYSIDALTNDDPGYIPQEEARLYALWLRQMKMEWLKNHEKQPQSKKKTVIQ